MQEGDIPSRLPHPLSDVITEVVENIYEKEMLYMNYGGRITI